MKKKSVLNYLLLLSMCISPLALAQEQSLSQKKANELIQSYLENTPSKRSFERYLGLVKAYPEIKPKVQKNINGTDEFKGCLNYSKMEFNQVPNTGPLQLNPSSGFSWEKMTAKARSRSTPQDYVNHWQHVAGYILVQQTASLYESFKESTADQFNIPQELLNAQVTDQHIHTFIRDGRSKDSKKVYAYSALNEFSADFDFLTNIESMVGSVSNEVKKCVAFSKITAENFDEDKRYKDEDYTLAKTKTSFDGKIKCKLEGPETVDFDECNELLYIYNGSAIAIAGNATIQQVQTANFGSEGNMKLMKGAEDPDSAATLALEVQKEGLEKQKSMAHTRQALQGAKLTLMLEKASSFPRQDDIIETCKSGETIKTVANDATRIIAWVATDRNDFLDDASSDLHCQDILYVLGSGEDNNGFLQNSDQLENIYALAAEAGIEVAKETLVSTQLGKQAQMIDGIINKVKDADVLDLPAFANMNDEQIANYCEANPQAPECLGFSGRTVGSITSPGLNVTTGFGQNEVFSDTGTDSSTVDPTSITTDDGANGAVNANRVISGTNKDVGFKDSSPGAAKVTSQVQSGGSGGGAGGGVSGGGLSGGGGAGGQKQGVEAGSRRKSKLAYSGGGRKLSFSGGNSRSRRSTKKSGNPFAKIFDKPKADKNGVLNFRGLASRGVGGKAGNIFDRISSKYNDVSSKDRLLKYEKTE